MVKVLMMRHVRILQSHSFAGRNSVILNLEMAQGESLASSVSGQGVVRDFHPGIYSAIISISNVCFVSLSGIKWLRIRLKVCISVRSVRCGSPIRCRGCMTVMKVDWIGQTRKLRKLRGAALCE
jgi:hypothetical protein